MVVQADGNNSPVTRADFDALRREWEVWRAARPRMWEVTSINDITSQSPTERLVTFPDSERVLMKAAITNTETREMMATISAGRVQFWKTGLGIALIVLNILAALVLISAQLYTVFIGLSHSILR